MKDKKLGWTIYFFMAIITVFLLIWLSFSYQEPSEAVRQFRNATDLSQEFTAENGEKVKLDGYAVYDKETEAETMQSLFEIADQRMYNKKQKMKKVQGRA